MFKLPKFGDGICLSRLAALLQALRIDRARLQQRSVVVTGSNGKGSTAAFCAGIGRAFGLRTGLFTSPHLYRFSERFQIDGAPIDDAALALWVARVRAAIDGLSGHAGFGAFEAQFALACGFFQEMDCDFLVFEAGIGGRFDPVRLIGAGATCVTSVDLEHVDLLGRSLEAIVSDKSDAGVAGGTTIYGENCRALIDHLAEYNRGRDVAALFVGEQITIANEGGGANGQRFDLRVAPFDFRAIEIALPGRFQINNAAIAVALFLLWLRRHHPAADATAIELAVRAGLRDTRWPGRLEIVTRDPFTVIDVGHTPDGVAQALAGLLQTHGDADWILVMGVSVDKDIAAIAARLAPAFHRIICTSARHKGADVDAVAAAARSANPAAEIEVAPTIADAVRVSRATARQSGGRIYVAGGLFVAIEYAHVARGGQAEELEFG